MSIHINDFRVSERYYSKDLSEPGMKVCPCNGMTSVGTVIDFGKRTSNCWNGLTYANVKVLWGTGKKRGKVSEHPAYNLIDLVSYLEAIKKELSQIESMIQEASTVGL